MRSTTTIIDEYVVESHLGAVWRTAANHRLLFFQSMLAGWEDFVAVKRFDEK
jgi:hypothetical protein